MKRLSQGSTSDRDILSWFTWGLLWVCSSKPRLNPESNPRVLFVFTSSYVGSARYFSSIILLYTGDPLWLRLAQEIHK